MKTFLARWENGDVSLVTAKSEAAACCLLDEIGDPFNIQLIPLKNDSLAIHFRLTDAGDLELEEEMNGTGTECFAKALPRIKAARRELYAANVKTGSDQWKERMLKAVEAERAREYPCNAEDAAWHGLGYDQLLDMERKVRTEMQ